MTLRVQNRSCNVASPRQLQRSGARCSSAVRSLHEDAVDDVGPVLETTFGETFPDSSDNISAKLPWSVQFRNDNIARRYIYTHINMIYIYIYIHVSLHEVFPLVMDFGRSQKLFIRFVVRFCGLHFVATRRTRVPSEALRGAPASRRNNPLHVQV